MTALNRATRVALEASGAGTGIGSSASELRRLGFLGVVCRPLGNTRLSINDKINMPKSMAIENHAPPVRMARYVSGLPTNPAVMAAAEKYENAAVLFRVISRLSGARNQAMCRDVHVLLRRHVAHNGEERRGEHRRPAANEVEYGCNPDHLDRHDLWQETWFAKLVIVDSSSHRAAERVVLHTN